MPKDVLPFVEAATSKQTTVSFNGLHSGNSDFIENSIWNGFTISKAISTPCHLTGFELKLSGTDNYANNDGIYTIDTSKLVDGNPIYVNSAKGRFIGVSGLSNWVLTSTGYLDQIIKQSQSNPSASFGGFYSNTNGAVPI